jgi:soluble lytic murein transglycosylase
MRYFFISLLVIVSLPGLLAQSSKASHAKETSAKSGAATTSAKKSTANKTHARATSTKKAKTTASKSKFSRHGKKKAKRRALTVAERKRLARMRHAFVASNSLRPMATQLLQYRTPAAYKGVEAFAARHPADDAGALARLAIGYAHILDKEFAQALPYLKKAQTRDGEIHDYSTYFLAQCYSGSAQNGLVSTTLRDFDTKYPESLFVRDAALMYANALISQNDLDTAEKILERHRTPYNAELELMLGRSYLKTGNVQRGGEILRRLYVTTPLSTQASEAKGDLDPLFNSGAVLALTYEERKLRAQQLMKGGRYADAAREFRDLASIAPDADRLGLQVAAGMALHRSGNDREAHEILDQIPDSANEVNAERLLALAEMARSSNDEDRLKDTLAKMRSDHTTSPYFEDGLLLGGNFYLLKKDYDKAIDYYRELQERFPQGCRASYAHWKAAWLSLRQNRDEEAKKEFEQQIQLYPGSPEVPAALYWRGRLAEDDHEPARALAFYRQVTERFKNYYYADLARERMKALGTTEAADDPILMKVAALPMPEVVEDEDTPADDLRVEKALLLENGGMLDFAVKELKAAADDGGKAWAMREIAKMYQDNGRYDRALETMKRAVPSYYAMDIDGLPRAYWEALFPRPWWTEVKRYAASNNLDPFLVASLIRQESEFNPSAVSRADAMGLMQLLPGTGRKVAKELKIRRFSAEQLTTPTTNIELGTRFFRNVLDEFNGRVEYALAAYNAGSDRVNTWLSDGKFRDTPEFVESIPFTETREYVQAIMRNASMYKRLYGTP